MVSRSSKKVSKCVKKNIKKYAVRSTSEAVHRCRHQNINRSPPKVLRRFEYTSSFIALIFYLFDHAGFRFRGIPTTSIVPFFLAFALYVVQGLNTTTSSSRCTCRCILTPRPIHVMPRPLHLSDVFFEGIRISRTAAALLALDEAFVALYTN